MTEKQMIALLRKTLSDTCHSAYAWMADMQISQVEFLAADKTMSPDLNCEAREYLTVLNVLAKCTDNEIADSMREAPID